MGQIMKRNTFHDALLKQVRYHGVNNGSHYSANIHFPVHLYSLPAKSCYGGEKKLGFASKTQGHKYPHHDGALFHFSGMVLMDKHTPSLGAYTEGVGRGRRRRVNYKLIK